MKASSNELLQEFLNGFPDASHPLDDERFARYSIACSEEGKYIDTEMISKSVSEERLEELVSAFEWIRTGIDCLKEDGRICNE